MPVKSTKHYVGTPRDTVANFHGMQVVYASWDKHLLFASPLMFYLSPDMSFRDFVMGPLTALIQPDPDSGKVQWDRVEWLKSSQPFTPDFDASLAANGIAHKAQLRFRTPGLNTLLPGA